MTRDNPRRPPVADARHEMLDAVADKAYDAIEFGEVDPRAVVSAIREAADEVEIEAVER